MHLNKYSGKSSLKFSKNEQPSTNKYCIYGKYYSIAYYVGSGTLYVLYTLHVNHVKHIPFLYRSLKTELNWNIYFSPENNFILNSQLKNIFKLFHDGCSIYFCYGNTELVVCWCVAMGLTHIFMAFSIWTFINVKTAK